MEKNRPYDLGNGIHLIDGFDLGLAGRTGTYVIVEEDLTLIETGPSPSIPYVLDGLKELGLNPSEVKNIIVTHIHLDHAGGAGLLLQECPNASVIVHPKGARHLADPTRLITGAKAVFGDKFDQLFDPILPVPVDRLLTKSDGDTLAIGGNRILKFLDTPGHAAHHFSIFDPVSNGIFSGDTTGIKYHAEDGNCNFTFYLPVTSPNQFDPDAMLHSIGRFRQINADAIYFGHFGMAQDTATVYQQVSDWIPRFVDAGKQALAEGRYGEAGDNKNTGTASQQVKAVAEKLLHIVSQYLADNKVPHNHPVYEILKFDLEVSAMGIVDYLNKA